MDRNYTLPPSKIQIWVPSIPDYDLGKGPVIQISMVKLHIRKNHAYHTNKQENKMTLDTWTNIHPWIPKLWDNMESEGTSC